jgi:hypothetical protein
MLTSVKVLSLDVCFGVPNDVKMMPTFLRCFPNAERLHIMVISCQRFLFSLHFYDFLACYCLYCCTSALLVVISYVTSYDGCICDQL